MFILLYISYFLNPGNIARADPILARAIQGSPTSNKNFGVGIGSASDADRLGQIWVGDGARLTSNQKECPGCMVSADRL